MRPIYKFEINRPTVNLLNPKTIVSGMLNTSTGNISSSIVYQTSDFIPVTPGVNYKLCDAEFTTWVASAACFYTANKTFISGQYGIGETPANAAYLRVSYQGLNNGYGVFPSTASSYSAYVSPIAYPLYKDDLAKDFELQSNQQFFRAKLSGKLTFVGPDYDFIVSCAFDFQFLVTLFISYDAGNNWTKYWAGTFWKTDCDFDGDARSVQVTPTVNDQYNDVLAGMEKEYNLIDLLPEIVPVKMDKRPMIQVYVPGQSVIGCFLSNMWWEQECEPVEETDLVTIDGNDYPALEYKYHFAKNATGRIVDVSGATSPELPVAFVLRNPPESAYFSIDNGTYTFWAYRNEDDPNNTFDEWYITRNSDNVDLWYGRKATSEPSVIPYDVILHPVDGTGATGDVTVYVHDLNIYARYVLDVMAFRGQNTYPLPTDDLVENNRNYHRAIGYAVSDVIYFSARLTSTPTQWGIYQPGQYYQQPYLYWMPEIFPVSRNAWGAVSIWFTSSATDRLYEESGRAVYTLKDAFPLSSVISVLLGKIASGITHDATTDYSQFLYGPNPITGITQALLITPKSNVISAGYDQPAQKAPITLKSVMDMLRDCFRCYWYVDDQNRFRIEHISYFMNGGSYSGTPVVGIDLTAEKVTRNNKEWAFARNQYKFDKPEMAARYQFGWMDDVTQLFEGFPIDIISKYVNPDNIEQIDVTKFTSDIDYILLNPSAVSKDGFALLSAITTNEVLQNAPTPTITLPGTFDFPLNEELVNGGNIVMTINVTQRDAACTISISFLKDGVQKLTQGFNYGSVGSRNYTFVNVPAGCDTMRISATSGGPMMLSVEHLISASGQILKLPYYNFQIDNNDHILQNAYVAFCLLQQYYAYDMPGRNYAINGVQMVAQGIKKLKNQTIRFPVLTDPDLVELVKTNLGNGSIEKISINLSSRNANATLKYDTE